MQAYLKNLFVKIVFYHIIALTLRKCPSALL